MKKVLLGIVLTLLIFFSYKYFDSKNSESAVLTENSLLIQEQLLNVGKLIVTEGHFSEVFNYKNSKEIFGNYFTSEKKALVVVNAEVTIAYDLSKIEYVIDKENKTLQIISIPKEEIKINPDLEYYDIQADYLNPFSAEDYNSIKETVKSSLVKKLEASSLKKNARTQLLSELSKFYILTNSMGWKLQYDEIQINDLTEIESIKL
ncbi:DUF4230 domain-containing protein [Urechidicola croceus]|uniref:DUF4230 domain-containing protein n=1 Tax=Urechidicola croceus TaxID=1850246 RepID=A0A1D8PA05_9FLAO|nr:DUF4230 domain-containing protein [Urechidicola croceus]AOW21418.1 hypothetical protein LPB138_12335 [Urechidicola croceus]